MNIRYWVELSGNGDGDCVTYWIMGLGNGHALVDTNDSYGNEDVRLMDFEFCLDSGMAAGDCGEIKGVCCFCPAAAGEPGVCEADYTQEACIGPDGSGESWILAGACTPTNPCPGAGTARARGGA